MRIIVYSETTASSVGGSLGRPEYSYYFILNKYLPCLSELGEVCHVDDPAFSCRLRRRIAPSMA